uniref:Retrovirus-related Pol polyprotein from transposon TNT 1-94 n=1 Tax=Cajanus cajan TaxID=3821 RepID=A0A151RFR7_CAJCA|nr:hypothetical protein KK1_037215 [Cajanus cajan]
MSALGFVSTSHLSILDVYYIPNFTLSLIYVSQLCDSRYLVLLSSTSYHVQDLQSKRLIGTNHGQGGYIFWMSCMFQKLQPLVLICHFFAQIHLNLTFICGILILVMFLLLE